MVSASKMGVSWDVSWINLENRDYNWYLWDCLIIYIYIEQWISNWDSMSSIIKDRGHKRLTSQNGTSTNWLSILTSSMRRHDNSDQSMGTSNIASIFMTYRNIGI